MFRAPFRSVSGLRHYARHSFTRPGHRVQTRPFLSFLFPRSVKGNETAQPSQKTKQPPENASTTDNDNSPPEIKPDTPQNAELSEPIAHSSSDNNAPSKQGHNGQEPQKDPETDKPVVPSSSVDNAVSGQGGTADNGQESQINDKVEEVAGEISKLAKRSAKGEPQRQRTKEMAQKEQKKEDPQGSQEVTGEGSDSAKKTTKRKERRQRAKERAQKYQEKLKKEVPQEAQEAQKKEVQKKEAQKREAQKEAQKEPQEEAQKKEAQKVQESQKTSQKHIAAESDRQPKKASSLPSEKKASAKKAKQKSSLDRATGNLDTADLALAPLNIETPPVGKLSYGLERVLYNPGVYQLRDPRSRVYNFDPYLGSIMPVTEFDFTALKQYITSSRDETLRNLAKNEGKKYVGSSSSMTSVLSHFHFLLSAWRPVDARTMSQGFPDRLRSFTRLLRSPAAMFLLYRDGVYSIDADKEFDNANILMNLGKSMEKLLTLPKEEFERYRRSHDNKVSPEEEQATPESYHYSTLGDFLMRSQLDAYDPRLPGTGMFDLKTRAVVSIRMDSLNFEHGVGYEIKGRYGNLESYEREYYDMIRAAFLKYALQVRIGRMDGIFVAFHNIERIFGFQYISLPEMDQALHGQSDTTLGDREFQLSLSLWNKILDRATAKYPRQSLRFHFETRDNVTPNMYVFAEPVTDDEVHAIQTRNQEKVDAYQRRILNLEPKEGERPDTASDSPPSTPDSKTQQADQPREPPSDTVQDSRSPPDYNFISGLEKEAQQEDLADQKELLGLSVTVKNKVNGNFVERPERLSPQDDWSLEYEMTEMEPANAKSLYESCQRRRERIFSARGEDETDEPGSVYIRRLRQVSQEGRKYRARQDEIDKEQGIVVYDQQSS